MRAETLPKDANGWLEYNSILTLSHDMENTIAMYEFSSIPDESVSRRMSRQYRTLHLFAKEPDLMVATTDHRSFILCMLHNKLLRLHRPAFIRSVSALSYEESRKRCLRSASAITTMLCNMLNPSPELVSFLGGCLIGFTN